MLRIQNSELKSQLHLIKSKLSEIKSKLNVNSQNNKSLLNPKYTDKYIKNKFNNYNQRDIDYELKEIQKQIKYYEEEISKKKYQSDNIFPITRYLNIKDEILEEKKKMEKIKTENNTLLSIYNTRIKNSEQTEIELSIKNTEEMKRNQIMDLKKEIKTKEIKYKELEYKLKEQRNDYSNLMTMINTIKNKITEAKFLKYENNDNKKVNYDEEIEKEQKNIEEEEKRLAQKENEYKKICNKNDREINRLTTLILEKKIFFKNKKDNIRRQELFMKKSQNGNYKTIEMKDDENIYDEKEDENIQNGFFLTEQTNINNDKKKNEKENNNIEEINTDINGGEINVGQENGKIDLDNNNNKYYNHKSKKESKKFENNKKNKDISNNNDNNINLENRSEKNANNIDNHLDNDLENLSGFILSEKNGIGEIQFENKENNIIKSNNFINSKMD